MDEKDPILQAPQEANTTKHINFLELEENNSNTSNTGDTESNEEESPTKKAWEELREDNKRKNDEHSNS